MKCDVCGDEHGQIAGLADAQIEHYRLGYEREKARADAAVECMETADAQRNNAADALAAARRECEELRGAVRDLLDVADRNRAGYPIEQERWYAIRDAARALIPPAAAPEAEVKVNACQVDLRTDKDRECFDDVVQAAARILRAPAPAEGTEALLCECEKALRGVLAHAEWLDRSLGRMPNTDEENARVILAKLRARAAPPEGEGT